jgi:hypothetical protein
MPGAVITHNAKLPGFESEVERQIDVLIEQQAGPYSIRVVVDCKDYKSPVDVKGVEEFFGLVQDVKAHTGAMVCPAGFSQAAKKRAKKLNISLFSPIDVSGGHRWSKPVALPTLLIFKRGRLGLKILCSEPLPLRIPTEFPLEGVLYTADGEALGAPLKIASAQWDQGKLPLEVGTYENLPLFDDGRSIHIDNGYGARVRVEITVELEVQDRRYYGNLPLAKMRGLRDEQTGGIKTNAFTTGELTPRLIENEWKKLEDVETVPGPVALTLQGLEAWHLPGQLVRGRWIPVKS